MYVEQGIGGVCSPNITICKSRKLFWKGLKPGGLGSNKYSSYIYAMRSWKNTAWLFHIKEMAVMAVMALPILAH